MANDIQQGVLGYFEFVFVQPVLLLLLRHQITMANICLFVFRVTGKPDDFHTIEQRRGNIQAIRRANEHDMRKIEIDLEIVIVESRVLLGIQHLEQRRRRVAPEVHRHLVDFIEQE